MTTAQRYTSLEIAVGGFVIAGTLALAYLAFTLGDLSIAGRQRYQVTARFSSVGDLKVGDPVKLAGVTIGDVQQVNLVDFVAEAELSVDDHIRLPEDTIASVQSAGLLGDAYVSLSPGASDKDLPADGRITRTEPAISITELIAKYAFGSPLEGQDDSAKGADPGEPQDNEGLSPFSDPLE